MQVATLGPHGTFSEEAALSYFGSEVEILLLKTIPDVFNVVEQRKVEAGVVPIENALEGSVAITMDRLIESDVKICGECIIPIHHHLVVKPETKQESIEKVISHPQVFGQCWKFIQKLKVDLLETWSTAEAARQVAEVDSLTLAAIAPKRAANHYNLTILQSEIEDNPDNVTRFVVLGKEDAEKTGRDKTSLVFSLRANHSGELYRALEVFAKRKVNMTRIESRPSKKALGDYFFFVDIEGHRTQPTIANAIRELQKRTASLKIPGSYPYAKY